jgi:hypothetical protein
VVATDRAHAAEVLGAADTFVAAHDLARIIDSHTTFL